MTTLLAHSRQWINDQIAAGKTSPTLSSSNCMVHGLTDAVGVFTNSHTGTLVANGTVGILQTAAHYLPGVGATVSLGGNSYIVAAETTIAGTDIGFCKLNAKVTGASVMKVLPTSAPQITGNGGGLPLIWIIAHSDRIQVQEVGNLSQYAWFVGTGLQTIVLNQNTTDPTWSIGTELVGGDSDSPGCIPINGELVLINCAHDPYGGTSIAHYRSASEAAWVSDFGITDTYTSINLFGFDSGVIMDALFIPSIGANDSDLGNPDNWFQSDGTTPLGHIPGPTETAGPGEDVSGFTGSVTCLSFNCGAFAFQATSAAITCATTFTASNNTKQVNGLQVVCPGGFIGGGLVSICDISGPVTVADGFIQTCNITGTLTINGAIDSCAGNTVSGLTAISNLNQSLANSAFNGGLRIDFASFVAALLAESGFASTAAAGAKITNGSGLGDMYTTPLLAPASDVRSGVVNGPDTGTLEAKPQFYQHR